MDSQTKQQLYDALYSMPGVNQNAAMIIGITVDNLIEDIDNLLDANELDVIMNDPIKFVNILYDKLLDLWDPCYVNDAIFAALDTIDSDINEDL